MAAEHVDRRARNDLALFVLAMIDRGVNTAYLLKTTAGISQGASIPILSRLEHDRLITSSQSGGRQRIEYHTTLKGRTFLSTSWHDMLSAPLPTDSDAVLRVVALALLHGAKRGEIKKYLNQASRSAHERAKQLRNKVLTMTKRSEVEPLLLYSLMRTLHSSMRLRAEASSFADLASELTYLKLL